MKLKELIRLFTFSGTPEYLDELLPEERHFLKLVAPLGLDWRTSRGKFAARYGITTTPGCIDTILLPPSTALSREPLQFAVHYRAKWADIPPEYATADYLPANDVHENFRSLECQLQEKLGEGRRDDVSNALGRVWNFGIFQIKLHGWPPELQHAGLRNILHEQNPNLAFKAQVTILSKYSRIFPDPSLNAVADAMVAGGTSTGISVMNISFPNISVSSLASIPYSVRNSRKLRESITAPIVWNDHKGRRFGVSSAETSLVFPRDVPDTILVNYKLHPARGSGGSELAVQLGVATENLREYELRTNIFSNYKAIEGVTDLAETLSRFWSLPVLVVEGLDD